MSKQRRSGYEPSDMETEGSESSWFETNHENGVLVSEGLKNMMPRNTSPMIMRLNINGGHHSLRFGYEVSSSANGSKVSPARRRHSSKSPYKPQRDDGNALSPLPSLDFRRNISPFSKAERERHISPYKPRVEEHNLDKNDFVGSRRKQKNRTPSREENGAHPQLQEVNRVTKKTNYRRRSMTAPRLRVREKDPKNDWS